MNEAPPPLGRIITFYSYKGGTGRSMALANVAWILASMGRRVLAIDWDLEAPGLHRYFRPFLIDEELTATEGLMDFVDRYANEAIRPLAEGERADPDWFLPFTDFSDYVVSINFPSFRAGGKIDLLPAGRQGDAYGLTVSAFNWQNFYDRLGGGGFFEAVKRRARAQYDYVLIDSRTGVSDTAGICSVQMPDKLVVCFTYNNQSIKGAAAVARSARATHAKMADEKLALYRSGQLRPEDGEAILAGASRPYRVFPAPMRVDSGESDRLAIRQAFARRSFADLVDHIPEDALAEYWKTVEVPHTVFYSYEEVLAPFKDDPHDPKTVLAAIVRLTRYVTDRDVTDFHLPLAPEERQKYLDKFAETPLTAAGRTALAESQRETPEQTAARVAESALAGMSEADRVIARRVLLRLVRLGRDEEGGGIAPARVPLNTFKPDEQQMITRLVASRLVAVGAETQRSETQPASQQARDTTERVLVTLADLRLVTSWRTLTEWVEEDRDFLLWRQRLRTYLLDWERSGRERSALLSGRLLGEADLRSLRRKDDLNDAELAYIAESREATAVVGTPASEGAAEAQPRPVSTPARVPLYGAIVLVGAAGAGFWGLWSKTETPAPPAVVNQTIQVPRFVGKQSREAKDTAEALGFKVEMFDGTSPAAFIDGVVAAQSLPENAPAARGAVLRLTVSAVTVQAPTLVGKNLTDALQVLTDQRLKLGKTDSRYVPDVLKPGIVVSQTPGPGVNMPAGAAIDVAVSRAAQLSDFRVGVYFLDSDESARGIAEKVRAVVKESGTDAQLLARPPEYFTGAYLPKEYEIRFNTAAERLAAEELQKRLKAGGLPPFVLTSSRRRTDGFISVFLPLPAASKK